MRTIVMIELLISFALQSCNDRNVKEHYLITTRVELVEGKIPDVLKLFQDTNPDLVKGQHEWIKAIFSANEEKSTVMVQAFWKNVEAYQQFASTEKFKNTMAQFGAYFKSKPEVEITKVLFEM